MPQLNEVLAVILGGGRGTRLSPLTAVRSKPAVPIAGKYRLIDIPISNCINSGIFKIAVLTQFNSVSLHRHINSTYVFDAFHTGWVQIWAAEQTVLNATWYQGTADAVRKQLFEIKSARSKYVLILAGDHLYKMDYRPMLQAHEDSRADVSVAVQPVRANEAGRFGILKRNPDGMLSDFAEKPKDPERLKDLVSRQDPEMPFIGSMGIYLFNTDVLFNLLQENPTFDDFGGDVIPYAIRNHRVRGHDFNGYWEDIGTIRSFYNANLMMTRKNSPFKLFDPERPLYTHGRFLPCTVVEDSEMEDVLLADGCQIREAKISHSVIGMRSMIQSDVEICDTIMMGSDYYDAQPQEMVAEDKVSSRIRMGIGAGSRICGAILDKNVRIGKNVVIEPFPRGTDLDLPLCVVRDGIVVVAKNTEIPAGTVIKPE